MSSLNYYISGVSVMTKGILVSTIVGAFLAVFLPTMHVAAGSPAQIAIEVEELMASAAEVSKMTADELAEREANYQATSKWLEQRLEEERSSSETTVIEVAEEPVEESPTWMGSMFNKARDLVSSTASKTKANVETVADKYLSVEAREKEMRETIEEQTKIILELKRDLRLKSVHSGIKHEEMSQCAADLSEYLISIKNPLTDGDNPQ